jgi:hypothetical protein
MSRKEIESGTTTFHPNGIPQLTLISRLAAILTAAMFASPASAETLFAVRCGGDPTGSRFERYDSAGVIVGPSFTYPAAVLNIAVDDTGDIYFPPDGTGEVLRLDIDNGIYSTFVSKLEPTSPFWSAPAQPRGLAFGADGFLYVGANHLEANVQRFTPDGLPTGVYCELATPAPFDLEFNSQGNLLVVQNYQVERFDSAGNSLGSIGPPSSGTYAIDVAIDSQDNVFVLDFKGVIRSYTPDGEQIGTPFSVPNGFCMAISDGDVLYVGTEASYDERSEILKYTLNGDFIGAFAEGLSGGVADLVFATIVPESPSFVLALALPFVGRLWRR